jgi:hypothetical protein
MSILAAAIMTQAQGLWFNLHCYYTWVEVSYASFFSFKAWFCDWEGDLTGVFYIYKIKVGFSEIWQHQQNYVDQEEVHVVAEQ